ncbi:MAG TPA: YcnI family protein [Streptosporangiaceae bacterium]|nr:YcnI family protein [Streptosporangiaceae bacterium]
MSIALAPSRSPLIPRTLRRITIVGAASGAIVLLFAAPAFAHITVTPDSVPAGSTTELTFHVPNEESKANTVKLDVLIPTTHPIAQLLVKAVPGWTATVKTITLPKPVTTDDGTFTSAVSEVIWSGGSIQPGQFEDFSISCDSLPDGAGPLAFKAVQTYSNGDIVRWIDLRQPGGPEPEHPAPVVTLTATSGPAKTGAAPAAAPSGSSSDGTARVLGIAGLVIGLLASALALTAGRRPRPLAGAGTGTDTAAPERASAPNGKAGDKALTGAKAAAPAGTKTAAKRPQQRRRG